MFCPPPIAGFTTGNAGDAACCARISGICTFQSSERIGRGSPKSTPAGCAAVDDVVPGRDREAVHAQRDQRGEREQQRGGDREPRPPRLVDRG